MSQWAKVYYLIIKSFIAVFYQPPIQFNEVYDSLNNSETFIRKRTYTLAGT